jgi:hypothetical protein
MDQTACNPRNQPKARFGDFCANLCCYRGPYGVLGRSGDFRICNLRVFNASHCRCPILGASLFLRQGGKARLSSRRAVILSDPFRSVILSDQGESKDLRLLFANISYELMGQDTGSDCMNGLVTGHDLTGSAVTAPSASTAIPAHTQNPCAVPYG